MGTSADEPHPPATVKMTADRATGAQTYQLPISRLQLRLIDPETDVWAIEQAESHARLRYIATRTTGLLDSGYIIRGRHADAAIALGRIPEEHCALDVRFTTARLRWRLETTTPARRVGYHLWVTEAAGAFDLAVLEADGEPIASTQLSLIA
jgi:hypothetical protein